MVSAGWKKWSFPVFASWLILVILGTFAFSMGEICQSDFTARGRLPVGSIYTYKNQTIDWLAGEAVSVTRANESLSSTLRSGALRCFIQPGTSSTAFNSAESPFQITINEHALNRKNLIILRLLL